jgi:hypothetical protein
MSDAGMSALAPPIRRPTIPIRRILPRVGRVQRQVRRLLVIHGPLPTGELARRINSCPTAEDWQLTQVRASARKFAVECGRRRSPGAPILWRLK